MSYYTRIIDLQKLGQAWDHVRKNKPACGVDQVTCDTFEARRKEELQQLRLELLEHRYTSLPVRQVTAPFFSVSVKSSYCILFSFPSLPSPPCPPLLSHPARGPANVTSKAAASSAAKVLIRSFFIVSPFSIFHPYRSSPSLEGDRLCVAPATSICRDRLCR